MKTPAQRDEVAPAEAHESKVKDQQVRQYDALMQDARSTFRAVEGWQSVRTVDLWAKTHEEAQRDYASGKFLIERIGGERVLDPRLMAVLLQLRQSLLTKYDPDDAAASMRVDLAVLGYYNWLNLQRWLGDLALVVERELFGQDPLQTVHGDIQGSTIEDRLRRFGEQLLPLLDRANRMMLRNLKALQESNKTPAPMVSVGMADQVNVASQQVNTTTK